MIVYAKTDSAGRIIAVSSASEIYDSDGWMEIDEGEGDRYNLAQSHYFPLPLTDDNGIYRYKLTDNGAVERSAAEMAADLAAIPAPPYQPTDGEKLIDQQNQLDFLTQCILEMSEIVYA